MSIPEGMTNRIIVTPEKKLAKLIFHTTDLECLFLEQPLNEADLETAKAEGVLPLLYHRLKQLPDNSRSGIQKPLLNRLKKLNHHTIAQEMNAIPALTDILQHIAHYQPVFLKGFALAHFYYEHSHLRPMQDIDFIIPNNQSKHVNHTLLKQGFAPLNNVFGEIVMKQFIVIKKLEDGQDIMFDVHTSVFNGPSLEGLLPYTEVLKYAETKEIFGQKIYIPCPTHCLIHASLHLMAHHQNSRKLIWLYDLWLLAEQLSSHDLEQLFEYSTNMRIAEALFAGLDRCNNYFPISNRILMDILEKQKVEQENNPHVATALLLASSQTEILWADWKSLSGTKNRLIWFKEHLFPDYHYIQKKYNVRTFPMVCIYYVWRIIHGSVRLIKLKF